MLTVLEALNLSADYLNKKGIEEPRLNAELLLAEVLKCKRLSLYLSYDRPLNESEKELYREMLKRRGNSEPLQYIIGHVDFYNFSLMVNKNALIPRQETELLVEEIIRKNSEGKFYRILDIGVGTGNISIALAKNIDNCEVVGIDISEDALQLAEINVRNNELSEKISLLKKDILKENLSEMDKFDIIVSNPPYVPEKEVVQKELDYEPAIALFAPDEGLLFYKTIAEKAPALLNLKGKIYFEAGKEQSSSIKDFLSLNNFHDIYSLKDYQGIERIISANL